MLSRAELQRRREQSFRDREQHRRLKQSAQDRQRHIFERLTRVLTQHILNSINPQPSTRAIFPEGSRRLTIMAPRLPCKPEADLKTGFESLFNNPKYSDVSLFLGASKTLFQAHRVVLGICSPYFDRALQSELKEGISNEFSFEKDSPHALMRVLQYMYTGSYSDEPFESLNAEGDDLELLKHPRVYALADMFRMEDLKKVSQNKFKLQLQTHWISDTFPDCIREVYSTSRDADRTSIRKVVVDVVSLHKEELVQKHPVQELIRESGDFAVDLVLNMANVNNGY